MTTTTLSAPVITTMVLAAQKTFFLGGWDAEMAEIEQVLNAGNERVLNKKLGWGAKASDYEIEMFDELNAGNTPVLIELEVDVVPPRGAMLVVDHHGPRAHEASALMQVLAILGQEPTWHQRLIAANDVGYIPAMQQLGTSWEEVKKIRLLDWQAQGVTLEQIREAEVALGKAEQVGRLTVVRMTHSKCAPVTDNLYIDREGTEENLLILSADGEINYFGNGALCATLTEKFGGWSGGSGLGDPESVAFWGISNVLERQDEILAYVSKTVS